MTEWGQRIQLIWGKNIPFDNFVPLIVEKSFPFFWYVGCWKRWATMGVRRCSRYGLCPTIHLSSICYDEVSDTFFSEAKTTKSKKEVMEEIILKSKFFKAQKAKDKEENEQVIE
ncbi:nucleolar 14 [Olea europaea subsp. europaea]|uniref:Nucleolar 14 n=1 Tax=Olea europaea subsp. europaea TaxID=158383 RepID=A0A8S0PIZ6_OLEEU|nr:nucleolar 14 [Olea europaea subsp. europaea]